MSFDKKREGDTIHYTIKAHLTFELGEVLVADIRQEMAAQTATQNLVLNLQTFDLSPKALRPLTPLGAELRRADKNIFLLADPKIRQYLKTEGIDKLLKPIAALSELHAAPAKPSSSKMDVNFINPFVEGTIHVLDVQCQMKVVPGKPMLKGKDFALKMDIAGLIGLTSQSFNGSIAICFPEKVFLKLISQMLGEEFPAITDELKDGAAEILNMIFGHAKRVLNENGHTIDKALPSVVWAPGLKIDHLSAQDSIILPFSTVDDGIFYMEVGTDKK